MPRVMPRDRRATMRFDKVFKVNLASEDFGEIGATARNISTGGMLIEMSSPLPLGSEVEVQFAIPDSHASIAVLAEVKNQYAFNFFEDGEAHSARGIGVKFIEFVEDSEEQLRLSLSRFRTLH